MATKKTSESVPVEQVSAAEDKKKTTATRKTAAKPAEGDAPVKKPAARKTKAAATEAAVEEAVAKPAPKPRKTAVKKEEETPAAEEVAPKAKKAAPKKKTAEQAPETAEAAAKPADDETPAAHAVDFSDEEAMLAAEAPEYDLGEEAAEHEHEEHTPEAGYDLAAKNKEELVAIFAEMLDTRPVQSLRRDAEAIKIAFYKLHRNDVEQLRKLFVEGGGALEEFVAPEDPQERRLKELFGEYRRKRDEFMATIEAQKEENLKVKLQIIEELKELISSGETLNHTFNTFRALQQHWKETGLVPTTHIKDLWDTYNHHVENFYSFIKINKELRDLDLRKNYEAKLLLCEEAEALVVEPSIVNAFHKLQKLHEQWRETGPVTDEYKETVWDRFREASSRINKQHQEHFEKIKVEQKRNLDLKNELCVKTEELCGGVYTSRKDWDQASDKLIEIQKIWKTIGYAPKKENTKVYERFRIACDRFFEIKRGFYLQVKAEMEHNLQLKNELCLAAEAVAETDQWKKGTEELIALQKRWKEIGPVPRRHSDAVWKRFRGACDRFFTRKGEHFSSVDNEYGANLAAKRALLAEIEAYAEGAKEGGLDAIKEFQRRWGEIGFVPIKQKEAIQGRYKELIDVLFASLRGGERERQMDRFRGKVTGMKDTGDRRLKSERERLYNKVRQLEADIALLENNIGFFAKSKNAEAMIEGVKARIEQTKAEMAETVEKINIIDSQSQQQ